MDASNKFLFGSNNVNEPTFLIDEEVREDAIYLLCVLSVKSSLKDKLFD